MITAHADLAPPLAEAELLDWLEDLGLDVTLDEQGHLLASKGSDTDVLIAELDLYALDGGKATQVRLRLSQQPSSSLESNDLADQLRTWFTASPHWGVDGFYASEPETAASPDQA